MSTHVGIKNDGRELATLYVDDFSDIFMKFGTMGDIVEMVERRYMERPGRPWSAIDGTVDLVSPKTIVINGNGLWDWPEVVQKVKKLRKEGWIIIWSKVK